MSENSRVRVSIVGVVVVALFASLLARLWFLQMGPEQTLGRVVSTLGTRVIQTESPRGEILDRNGKILAQDVAAWAVTVDRDLGPKTRDRVLGQLAELLGIDEKTLRSNYDSVRQSPLEPAIVALRVPLDKQLAIREHQEDYPSVHVVELTVRSYPYDGLASQVLGYVGEIGADQLKQLKSKGYQAGDLVGREGVESAYESALHGKPRRVTVQVDPTGKQVGAPVSVDPGTVGDNVKLTLDAGIQAAAENALKEGILAARTQKDDTFKLGYRTLKATGGAVVVLNVHDGSVVAMANYPSYPLSWWVGGISTDHFALLANAGFGNPLLNRATDGQYAPGSTFKIVPAIALNQFGVLPASQYVVDNGSVTLENTPFSNDNGTVNGPVNLQRALTVSSDVYFYNAGNDFWKLWLSDPQRGLGLQTVAHQLGFGQPTGIEIGDAAGRVPDPVWKKAYADANYKKNSQPWRDHATWYPGDDILAAVGQGSDLVTPLQLANAYACFANANGTGVGTLWTPHVGESVIDPVTKRVVQTYTPKVRGKINIPLDVYSQIAAGFTGVVSDPKGTAVAPFQGLTVPVAGKTGTAQVPPKGSTSVFASYFPADNPQYAVVALVEEGGHGATTAAPIVRQVIENMNHIPPTPIPTKLTGKD